ncbi:MAG: ATP-binding protein [Lachnospiraceae bacterium]|nr:ATP-binding protein [Lachnospiraceae bacterium]
MSLTQEQYDSIMHDYQVIRSRHENELRARRAEVYAKIPEYRTLDREIPDLGARTLRRMLAGDSSRSAQGAADPAEDLQQQILAVQQKKRALLTRSGFPADYLEPTWDCPLCHDTGYLRGEKCTCFKKRESAILSRESNLGTRILTENFEHLSYAYHTGEDLVSYRRAVEAAIAYADSFSRGCPSLYYYGTCGTGKSFLSTCIAQRLIERGFSVRYFSAAALFDRLAALSFGSLANREELRDFTADLYSCDLLILDDLGTELTNAFVTTSLFSIINERFLHDGPCIISSNLTLQDLQKRYSDRVFSRITNSYDLFKFSGPDIRILKRRELAARSH